MIKQYLLPVLLLSMALIGCQPAPEQPETPPMELAQYGEALSLTETTSINDILANPKAFVGQKVRIEGRIKDVCPMEGCWIEVENEDGTKSLTVKVNDGEIVFKPESTGKHAVAEGEVYAIELTHENAISYMAHLAEEKGEAFDSTSVTGPMTIYQIKGVGAEVEE